MSVGVSINVLVGKRVSVSVRVRNYSVEVSVDVLIPWLSLLN